MASLTSNLNQPFELAKRYNKDGTSATLNGGAGGVDFNFNLSDFANTTGLVHTHENNAGNLSIFSPDDFRTFFLLVSAANPADRANYTYGVVTSSGSYLLSINSLAAFMSFKNDYFTASDPQLSNGFNFAYSIFVKTTNTAAENELGLVNFMTTISGSTGLTLLKNAGTDSAPVWSKVSNDNGTVSIQACPN